MHFKWNYKYPTPEEEQAAKELGEKLNMSPILTQPSDSSAPSLPTSSIRS